MKPLSALLLTVLGCLLIGPLAAQTPPASPSPAPDNQELDSLKTLYLKHVSTTAEPLQKRYIADLNKLLDQFTRAPDLDSALEVKTELARFSPADPGAAPLASTAAGSKVRQLKELRRRFDREVEATLAPLKQKYLQALERLEQNLTKSKQLEASVKVREEITTVKNGGSLPAGLSGTDPLINTEWRWGEGQKTLKLLPDGLAEHSDWSQRRTWERVDDKTLHLYDGAAVAFIVTFQQSTQKVGEVTHKITGSRTTIYRK